MSHTPTPRQAPSSSSTPQSNRRDSVTSELTAKPANVSMLRIKNLLNPVAINQSSYADESRLPTPADTSSYTPTPTPCPDTPLTPASTKQPKIGKDNGVVLFAAPKSPVNYSPYECNDENTHHYNSDLGNELIAQHKVFRICTAGSGGHGSIGDFPKHVPYASEKKGFFSKTGRDAFEVFQYKFFLPGDTTNKEYTVMWDYQIGLMRMTPFFKACGFQKTTPAKALKVNPGLIDLCHSITGGALTAQGYWVPFACARAVCLTFCWDIRWALTPIFGPDFVTQCLPPNHPNYKLFRIDGSIVQNAALEAENWRVLASRSVTPASRPSPATYGAGDNPRPLPPTSAPISTPAQEPRPKRQRPEFKAGSPFAYDYQHHHHHQPTDSEDEAVSPKSCPVHKPFPSATTAWTSINRSTRNNNYNEGTTTPSPPNNTPVLGAAFTHSIRDMATSPGGFRNANGRRSVSPLQHIPSQKKLEAAAARASARRPPPPPPQARERKRSLDDGSVDDEDDDFDSDNVVVSSSSKASYGSRRSDKMSVDSDSDDVVASPTPPPPSKSKGRSSKRTRRVSAESESEDDDDRQPKAKRPMKIKWTAADEEAARILMRLNREDAGLAYLNA